MTARLSAPGIYDIPEQNYHSDPCPVPSLSSSIAAILIAQSPRHAWHAHPRLNPKLVAEHSKEFDLGKAVHALVLEGDDSRFAVVEARDYRTDAARAARDAAYPAGKIPLLPHQLDQVRRVAEAVALQLAAHSEAADAFAEMAGKAEQAVIWQEEDIWCRALVDWLPDKPRRGSIVYDLKSTTNAEPGAWSRSKIVSMGYDIQAAFYLRGLRALGYPEMRFAFVVVEIDPPHAISVVGLTPALMEMGAQKVDIAIETWRRCIATGQWPAYPNRICWVEPQPYEAARWLERLERPTPDDIGRAMLAQAPLEGA